MVAEATTCGVSLASFPWLAATRRVAMALTPVHSGSRLQYATEKVTDWNCGVISFSGVQHLNLTAVPLQEKHLCS